KQERRMFGIVVGAGLVIAGTFVLVRHRHGVHRGALNCALRRLKATEEQKQRLQALADETHGKVDSAKQHARKLRSELLGLWQSPNMDAQRLESLESQLFEAVGEGTQAVREAILRAHEILDPRQREQVASWLNRMHHHHCHRHAAC
ncbi:MAG TPA: periplasmic heavy metal sensor, partial [Polyangiaceae bacterium]